MNRACISNLIATHANALLQSLSDTEMADIDLYTCLLIKEGVLNDLSSNGKFNLSTSVKVEIDTCIRLHGVNFVAKLNAAMDTPRIPANTCAFIHKYAALFVKDLEPYGKEFVLCRKAWLNYLITGKLEGIPSCIPTK